MRDGAISAGALAEHAATPGPATAEALFDCREHFMQQEILPSTRRDRVDILVAAKPSETIGEGDDDGWHALFPNQPIEPLRQVLAEADPIRFRQAAAREPNKIYKAGAILVPHVRPGRRNLSASL